MSRNQTGPSNLIPRERNQIKENDLSIKAKRAMNEVVCLNYRLKSMMKLDSRALKIERLTCTRQETTGLSNLRIYLHLDSRAS